MKNALMVELGYQLVIVNNVGFVRVVYTTGLIALGQQKLRAIGNFSKTLFALAHEVKTFARVKRVISNRLPLRN
ncbi:MAG: hypothetical protein NTX83_05230 [Burkholderiales bacterium]|nr:hypothetical protein [Burkholderiales bacterium]